MLNIDSKLWSVRSYNKAYAHIIQRASNVIRTVSRSSVPSNATLAAMSEQRFNSVMRDLFHNANRD